MKDITKENIGEFISQDGINVIDFYADWCGPCKRMMPLLNKVEAEYEGKVNFGKVNSDQQPELLAQFAVQGVPTFMFFKGGWGVHRFTGVRPINLLRQDLDKLLGEENGSQEKGSSEEVRQEEVGLA